GALVAPAPALPSHCSPFLPIHSLMSIPLAKIMCGHDSGRGMESSSTPSHFAPRASPSGGLYSTIAAGLCMPRVTSLLIVGRVKSVCSCVLPTLRPADAPDLIFFKSRRRLFRPRDGCPTFIESKLPPG